jgi:protein involved in sex pheromone biosynthesis
LIAFRLFRQHIKKELVKKSMKSPNSLQTPEKIFLDLVRQTVDDKSPCYLHNILRLQFLPSHAKDLYESVKD